MSIGLNADLGLSFQDKQMNLEISSKIFCQDQWGGLFKKLSSDNATSYCVKPYMGIKEKYN